MLRLSLLFALITTLTILSVCQAGCKLNDKKLKKSIKKYSKTCTSKGFQSSLGCPSTKMMMSSKQEEKCKKMEGKLVACDYSCEVTAAPTEPPTKPPTEPPTKKPEPAESNILNSKMVAAQKDVGWDGVPSRAIDGNTDGRYDAGSCTHSATNDNNWWEVHLDGVFSISKVVIFNREDSCCKDRINEAKVYAGEVYCGDVEYEDGKNVYEIDCGGTLARSIVIRQPNNILTLCEVQAFGKASNDECIERQDAQGAAYRGTKSVTESGLTCQRWDSQTPNKHQLIPERYPAFGLEENYCRNPDGEPRPWCYNSESTSPRWEHCDIPTC